MTAGADLRLLRAAVFTAVCVTLSAAGHTLAGGSWTGVSPGSWGAACAVVFAVAAPLAGRERSLPGIAALLAVGQVALHTLFVCGVRPMPGIHGSGLSPHQLAAHSGHMGMTGHAAHASGASAGGAGGAGAGGGGGFGAGFGTGFGDAPLTWLRGAAHAALSLLDGPMLLAHLFAALVLGWLLRRGEVALWRLVRLSARSAWTIWSQAPDAAARLAPVRTLRTAVACARALCAGLLPQAPPRAVVSGTRQKSVRRFVLLRHSVRRRGPPQRAFARTSSQATLAAH